MALTIDQWKAQLLREVGAGLDGVNSSERAKLDSLTANIDVIWDMNEDRRIHGGVRLQYLWAKIGAIDHLLGQLRLLTSASIGGLSPRMDEKLKNLHDMRADTVNRIELVTKETNASRQPAIDQLDRVAPIEVNDVETNSGQFDPNARRYRGDPVYGRSPNRPYTR